MLIILWISTLLLIYTLIGYPVVLACLSLLFGKKVEKYDVFPSVSLIISAYNEEDVIGQKIENSLDLDYPPDKLEIIVASESSDNTNAVVSEYLGKGIKLIAYEGRQGKSATLYRTVPGATGEIIVFSDANAMYGKDAIKMLVRNFNDERIGCVSGRLRYVRAMDSAGCDGESTYWEFDMLIKRMESRLFSLSGGVNGSIFAIRKSLYSPIDKFRGDDFEIANRVQINGFGVVMESEAVSFEEASQSSKQEFKRKLRLVSWNLRSTMILLKEAIAKKKRTTAFILLSHRCLRYCTPLMLAALFISNAFTLKGIWALLFAGQLAFYSIAAAGFFWEKKNLKINKHLLIPFYFCMVSYAALLGILNNILGKTQLTWEKVR